VPRSAWRAQRGGETAGCHSTREDNFD